MELIYKVALTFLTKCSNAFVCRLEEVGLTPEDFFKLPDIEISNRVGISEKTLYELGRENALERAKTELEFMNRHSVHAYFLTDDNYPALLKETANAPVILYQLGDCNLDSSHIISIVGTRHCTSYGQSFCHKLVDYLAPRYDDLIVVSGLAYGIDAAAHEGSLVAGCRTVGVLAHGLDMIYPAQHRSLAQRILQNGGALITEYPSGSRPYRQRFLERNRIVATMSHGVVVAESDIKGGAMSTANVAFSYSRDVLALPGKLNDRYSSGCNLLIRQHKADIITAPEDVENSLVWSSNVGDNQPEQPSLFPELDGETAEIYDLIREHEKISIDSIADKIGYPVRKVMDILTEMELDDLIIRQPGNRYTIL